MSSFDKGLVVPAGVPEQLVGSILQIIEAAGLPDRQEKSIKDLVRNQIYELCFSGSAGIQGDLYKKIIDTRKENIKKQDDNNPMQEIDVSLADLK